MMDLWQQSLWQQFGAAIDYLEQNIAACPDELWQAALWQTDDTQTELLAYLAGCRARCRTTITSLTVAAAQRPCAFGWGTCSFLELVILAHKDTVTMLVSY